MEKKKKERAEVRSLPSDYPWGKNAIDRDESGRIKARTWTLDKDIPDNNVEFPGLAAQMGRQGAGAPLRGKSGRPRTKLTSRGVDASTGLDKDIYDPWGRPGGGAPMRDRYGHNTGAGVYGAHATEKRSAHEHVAVDKREAEREYGMDVASWMRTGEVGMPKSRNPVTGQPIGANRNISDVTAIVRRIKLTGNMLN
ncbi:MAG: hypothetical protein MJE68_02220 [Proteobacteria bacterium]|nr:hypothetical protein [Pseudomonadota bacterium]